MRPTLMALEDRRLLSTIVVNNPTDTPIVGEIDLRQAIAQANSNGGDETIVFDKTVFKTPQTITLAGTQLELTDTIGTETIVGPKKGVTVSGGGKSRVFQVDSGVTASISGMTIAGGKTAGGGGGLHNDGGTLTLTNCTVSDSSSVQGGGLYSLNGTTTLTDCTVSGNSSTDSARFTGGGGVVTDGGTTTLIGCTVCSNSAIHENGGGVICVGGTRTLATSTNSCNSCQHGAGGLSAISGTTTLTDCTVSGNSVGVNGFAGGLGFDLNTTTLTNCTISGNSGLVWQQRRWPAHRLRHDQADQLHHQRQLGRRYQWRRHNGKTNYGGRDKKNHADELHHQR